MQGEPATEAVTLSSADVADALRQVVRAASTDDARAVLTGVLLTSEDDGMRMVATDSYRLAVRDLPDSKMLGEGQKVLVPSRALNELQRVLGGADELQVRLGARDAVFESGGTRLTTRLIEGEYPNYRNLLPPPSPERAHGRARGAARGAAPREDPRPGGQVGASATWWRHARADGDHPGHRPRRARRSTPTYEGTEMTVAFNPDYLQQGVEAVDAEEVTLSTLDAMKPAVIRGVGRDDYLYLLMPVRVP